MVLLYRMVTLYCMMMLYCMIILYCMVMLYCMTALCSDLSTASLPPGSRFEGTFTALPAMVGLQFLETL